MARVTNGARLWRVLAYCACAAAISIQAESAAVLHRAGEGFAEVDPIPNLARNSIMRREISVPKDVQQARQTVRHLIGAFDSRAPVSALTNHVAQSSEYDVLSIRWSVLDGVHGEGLWLKAKKRPHRVVVAIPDAEQTPEMVAGLAAGVKPELQFARRLAESGCDVLVPVLIRRAQREELCREALEAQRHLIGYEVQKVLAGIDWLKREYPAIPVAAVGYGEGGLIALYAAALDTRIDATLLGGCFDPRRAEPFYRRIPGLGSGGAEIASLIAPRTLLVEYSVGPALSEVKKKRTVEPDYDLMAAEVERAQALAKERGASPDRFTFIYGNEGMLTGPVGELALNTLLRESGLSIELKDVGVASEDLRKDFDPEKRQKIQREELLNYSRKIVFWRQFPPLWRY